MQQNNGNSTFINPLKTLEIAIHLGKVFLQKRFPKITEIEEMTSNVTSETTADIFLEVKNVKDFQRVQDYAVYTTNVIEEKSGKSLNIKILPPSKRILN